VVDHEPLSDNEVKRDLNLAERLIRDELAGILAFAIRGLKRLRDNGYKFTTSLEANSLLEEIKEANDAYLVFVRNRIVRDENAFRVKRKDVRDTFNKWCALEGNTELKEVSSQKFWDQIRRVFKDEGIPFIENSDNKKSLLDGISIRTVRDDNDLSKFWNEFEPES
jgi:hypothetical protein